MVGKNNRVLGSTSFGRITAGSTKGGGANDSDSPRPVRAAVKALNDQVKESAERIDRAVKKVVGQKDTQD